MTAAVHGPRVTQADRDAVFAWQNASSHAPNKLAQAFARHREASQAELVEALERALEAPMLDHSGRKEGVYDIIRAALTKARTDATGEGA